MRNKQQLGFTAIEGILILVIVGIVGFTGWYVWHGQQVKKVTDYNSCIKAGGKRVDPTVIGAESDCKIYGMMFTDPGKINWEVGQRYTDITHKDNLPPAIVIDNTGNAPVALVSLLKKDNGGCAINSPATGYDVPKYTILKVEVNKFAKLNYGCKADNPDAYAHAFMIVVNTMSGWRETSPTNQFSENGVPSCALVNHFAVSNLLEPKCWTSSSTNTNYETNKNP